MGEERATHALADGGGRLIATRRLVSGCSRVRELAHRADSDVEVSLRWRRIDNSLTLLLLEVATGVEFEFSIPPDDALDAFNHPYAYLPFTIGPDPVGLSQPDEVTYFVRSKLP
jgi:hypothetical protein